MWPTEDLTAFFISDVFFEPRAVAGYTARVRLEELSVFKSVSVQVVKRALMLITEICKCKEISAWAKWRIPGHASQCIIQFRPTTGRITKSQNPSAKSMPMNSFEPVIQFG